MGLRDQLIYSKAWVSGQGTDTIPAVATTEGDARANLQVQHTEAREKINEIVESIVTTLGSDNLTIPTSKAVRDALASAAVQSNWTQTNASAADYIKNKPALATVATSGNYNDLTNKPTIPPGVTVDSALSSSSTNPVQNKVINTALSGKANSSHTHTKSQITDFPTISGTSGYIAKFTGTSSLGNGFVLTIRNSNPSGGNDGDVWIKYS